MSGSLLQFVKAIYPYSAEDQGNIGLPLAESTVVYVVERLDDGWCRGYTKGKEGWFPASYTKTIKAEVTMYCIVLYCIILTLLNIRGFVL